MWGRPFMPSSQEGHAGRAGGSQSARESAERIVIVDPVLLESSSSSTVAVVAIPLCTSLKHHTSSRRNAYRSSGERLQ